MQRTILQSESGNRYLAKGYGVRAVLVCLPRMFLDCLIFTGPMLALVALRVYLSYPFCQRDPQDIRFGRDTDKGCSTEELTYRIIESSIVAFVSTAFHTRVNTTVRMRGIACAFDRISLAQA